MKIAAASCSKIQQIPIQNVWREIQNEQPDALVLLGDNVYLDHDHHSDPSALKDELKNLYRQQFAEAHFAALIADMRARGAPILATYDDHDFLGNNRYGGDHSHELRRVARDEFVSWFTPPMTGSDIYSVTSLGPVTMVILDERFYRTAPSTSGRDRDGILGYQQWAWLENIVGNSNARYLVVASSSTFHQWGDESWEDYPAAFERLRTLIAGRRGCLVLSGDVHRNAAYDDSGVVEIVTSAVARRGIVFGAPRKNYGILTFGEERLNVDLRSLKAGGRLNFDIPLSQWAIP